MAQKRSNLTIESNAYWGNECLYTSVDLTELTKTLMVTKISDDAGKFVCEGLYYQVLKYIQAQHLDLHCIFVHVPLLETNQSSILQDFQLMIGKFADKDCNLSLDLYGAHTKSRV